MYSHFRKFLVFLRIGKNRKTFLEKPTFQTFWKLLSKSTTWDGLYIELAKLIFFGKKSSFFFQKTPPVFQENPKFETFENFQAKIPFETHSIEILPMSSFFRKFRRFSQITDLLSQKSQTVEHFQTSWEIVILKRKLEVKCHFYRFCTEKDLFKNNIYFSEKTQRFDCFEPSEAIWMSDNHSRLKMTTSAPEVFHRFFRKKTFFFRKRSDFDRLKLHKQQ